MMSRNFLLILSFALWMPATAALAQGQVDADDYLAWQQSVSFAPTETVEFVFEYVERPGVADAPALEYTLVVTNARGGLVGSFEVELPPLEDTNRDTGRSRGFGFVTMEGRVDAGILFINGTPIGEVAPSPYNGRRQIGVSLHTSHPPIVPAGRQVVDGGTLTVVAPDGSTGAAYTFKLNNAVVPTYQTGSID